MTTPYRTGKNLDNVIPPDRRRQRAIMMIVGGMIGGAVLIEGARILFAEPVDAPVAPPPVGSLSSDEVSRVVAENKAEVRNRCFSPYTDLEKATVTIELDIASNGVVQNTHYDGTDRRVTACVDREVRSWQFPAHGIGPVTTTRIPFIFERIGGR